MKMPNQFKKVTAILMFLSLLSSQSIMALADSDLEKLEKAEADKDQAVSYGALGMMGIGASELARLAANDPVKKEESINKAIAPLIPSEIKNNIFSAANDFNEVSLNLTKEVDILNALEKQQTSLRELIAYKTRQELHLPTDSDFYSDRSIEVTKLGLNNSTSQLEAMLMTNEQKINAQKTVIHEAELKISLAKQKLAAATQAYSASKEKILAGSPEITKKALGLQTFTKRLAKGVLLASIGFVLYELSNVINNEMKIRKIEKSLNDSRDGLYKMPVFPTDEPAGVTENTTPRENTISR